MYSKNISGLDTFCATNYLYNQGYLQLVEENLFDSVESRSYFYRQGIRVNSFFRKAIQRDLYEIDVSKIIPGAGFFLSFIRKMLDNYFLQIKNGKIIFSAYVLDANNKQKFVDFLTNKYLKMQEPLSREQLPISFYPGDHILDQAGIVYDINFLKLSEVSPAILAKQGVEILRVNLTPNCPSILIPLTLFNSLEKIINEKIINYVTIFSMKNSKYFDNYLNISQKVNCPEQVKKTIDNAFFLKDKQRQPFLMSEITRNIMKAIMASEWKNYFLTPMVYENDILMANPDDLIPKQKDFSILSLLASNLEQIIPKKNSPSLIDPAQVLFLLKSNRQIFFNRRQIRSYFPNLSKDEFNFVYQEFLRTYSQKQSLRVEIPEIIILKDVIVIGEKIFYFLDNSQKKISRGVSKYFLEYWIEKISDFQVNMEMTTDSYFNRQIDLLVVNENPDFFKFINALKVFIEKNPSKFQSERAVKLLNIINSWEKPSSLLGISRSDLYSQALYSADIGFLNRLLFQIKSWFKQRSQKNNPEQANSFLKEEKFLKDFNNSRDKRLQTFGIDSFEKLRERLNFLWQELELPGIEIISRNSLDLSIKDIVRNKKDLIVFNRDFLKQLATNYLNRIAQKAFGLKDNKLLEEYIFLKMVEVYLREF